MSYPDGMTKSDWAHIDGEQHSPECPMHENNFGWHSCSLNDQGTIEWDEDSSRWKLFLGPTWVVINGCPWCLEELADPQCTCARKGEL